MDFVENYLKETDPYIAREKDGSPNEDDLREFLYQMACDIDDLRAFRDLLNPLEYSDEEIAQTLLKYKIWKEK